MLARRWIAGVLVGLAGALLIVAPALASGLFPDVPSNHPYVTAIEDLAARKIIGGYNNGNFGPEDLVKRQHFAKMIVLTMGFQTTIDDLCTFTDVFPVVSNDPLYPDHYIAVAARTGLTTGYLDNTFRPDSQITRQQVITMAVRAGGLKLETPPEGWVGLFSYEDPTHGENIRKAEFNSLLDDLVGPLAYWDATLPATRGECAQILFNLSGYVTPTDWEVVKYSGSGDEVLDIEKPHGPALVWVRGNAESAYFGVTSYGSGTDGPYSLYDLLANTADPYEGISLIDYHSIFGQVRETTRLQIKATGSWSIEIRPLSTARSVGTPGEIQGVGDDVILVTGSPSKAHIVGNAGSRYFGVIAYYGPTAMYDLLVNTANPYDGRVMFTHQNAYLLEVRASQPWSITTER